MFAPGDRKSNFNKRIESFYPLLRKILLSFKPELEDTRFKFYISPQQVGYATVLIGAAQSDLGPVAVMLPEKENADTFSRFSFCGIQYMCGKLTHSTSPPTPLPAGRERGTEDFFIFYNIKLTVFEDEVSLFYFVRLQRSLFLLTGYWTISIAGPTAFLRPVSRWHIQ